MKAIARVVSTSFWQDPKVTTLFTPEDKYFMLYLLTNPHTTQLGIYQLVPKIAAFEMGYSTEAVISLIDRFENKYQILKYNRETNEVAIRNYLKYSVVKGGKPVIDCLLREEANVKDKTLLLYIFSNLKDTNNLNNTIKDYIEHLNDIDIYNNDNERIVLAISCDFLRLKEMVIEKSERLPDEGVLTCEWCGNKVNVLDKHHFPIPKSMNGTEMVNICKKCHSMFHTLEYQNRMGEYSVSLNGNKENADDVEKVFELLWKMYPRKKGKGSVKPSTKRKIYKVGFETMKKCIERYKEFVDGRDEQFIMYGSTFFNSGYVDYLDENYLAGSEQSTEEIPREPETEPINLMDVDDETFYKLKNGNAL